MPTAKENTYIVTPVDGSGPYEVKAESYTYDSSTGHHVFSTGEEVVANLLNVNVRKQQD
jgi:hypothetical protein